MTIEQAFAVALQHHQSGRLAEAEALYRQILAVQPNHADALHLFGVVAHQFGQHDVAVERIRRAITLSPANPIMHSNLGEAYRAMGRLDEAVAEYHRALQLKANYPDALYNLGNALRNLGRRDEAVAAYRRALDFQPNYPDALNNLGTVLSELRQFDEAIAAFRGALACQPNFALALNNLAGALMELRKDDEAIVIYRRALELQPDYPEAHTNLGSALRNQGRLEEAVAAYRRALRLKPDLPEAHEGLGDTLKAQGLWSEAAATYRRALEIKPAQPKICHKLGIVCARMGRTDEAISAYEASLHLRPGSPEVLNNLGNALRDAGQVARAEDRYRLALQRKPEWPEVLTNLGNVLRDQGKLDEALEVLHRAIVLNPDYADTHNSLANILKDQGCLDEAVAQFRRALLLAPDDAAVHSNLICTLHFHPGGEAKTVDDEQRRWNERFGVPLRRFVQAHANDRDPNRRLRVGYVSPDFWSHVICHFFTPLLEAHDRAQFEIFCYASVKRPDALTERMKKSADVWRDVRGLGDEPLAALIRQDGIDLLVDLTLHMADNRLPMLARKPAPVQVTWLGYPGSSGLPAMDWRLTDARMDPEGAPWSASPDKPFRLPDTACCFDPLEEYPPVNELPALHEGHVTFGCLNNFCKTNDAVFRLWAAVLAAVPRSRLLLRCPQGSAQARVRTFFAAQDIAADRLELNAWTATREEFFRLFGQMDIALDPFPYNGGTTTCECLWMGVPVLTLPGTQPAARQGLSLLTAAGLGEFAATDEADFLSRAVSLAADLPRLAQLRATLRARLQASPLMDAPRFARAVEAAYREMWRGECLMTNA